MERRRRDAHRLNCSNRTFMELKWLYLRSSFPTLKSSNRTFMDLKWNGGDEMPTA